MGTLVALGYLAQDSSRRYRLALRVIDLGMGALNSTALAEHARPYLGELLQRTRFTVSLGVLDGPEVVYVERLCSYRRGQGKVDLGLTRDTRLAIHCTAIGKLLLAYLPEPERRRVLRELTLSRSAPNTIITKKGLRGELDRIREQGIAVSDQEFARDLISMAAPVRDCHEVIAAISLEANSSTIPAGELVDGLGPHLISTADRISARLGYRRQDERLGVDSSPGRYAGPAQGQG
jgi:IclR family pca regulon transcriptional regulator